MNGLGANLHYLSGGSPKNPEDYYGKKITSASLRPDDGDGAIYLGLANGKRLKIWDNGRSCCESRYITTDDDIHFLVGGKLKEIKVRSVQEIDDGDGGEYHEMAFLEISTEKGSVTFVTHNEHNGYYGGFGLSLDEVQDADNR